MTLLGDRLRAQMDVEYYSKRYADAANTSKLPAYTVLNASVRFKLNERISLWAYGDNLNQLARPDRGQSARGRADQRPGQ